MKHNKSSALFKKQDKPVVIVIVGILFLFLAFFFYATQILYPAHVLISLLFLYFTYRQVKKIYFYFKLTKKVNYLEKSAQKIPRFYKVLFGIALVIFALWYIISSINPNDKDIFISLTNQQQTELVDEDLSEALVLTDMLVLSGDELLNNPSMAKKELTQEEGIILKKQWENFLGVAVQSEAVTDRHRYFSQISLFSNKETHTKSFVIAYALYMKKFEYFHRVITRATSNPLTIKLFNEYSPIFGQANLYNDVTSRFFASNSFLRRNLGYLYFRIIAPPTTENISSEYAPLLDVANKSYAYLFKNVLSHITDRSLTYKYEFDKKMFGAWLPIQKTFIVNKVGNIHVGERKDKFITLSQIEEMKKSMEPGDILVYRKNWYASNLGVPGFWTHAGLYTGTLVDMDAFFASEFPYKGYSSFSKLTETEYPEVYQVYAKPDKKGYMPSVIESQTHGTIIQSLQVSASVDYFGAVRSKLEKKELLEALTESFSHFGKPYDFSFDLDTKDQIFCSELVYDAYLKTSTSKGVLFPKTLTTGKNIVIPNGIVEKFGKELGTKDQELYFVYFLDAREETQTAFVANAEAFVKSATRPKYSLLQQ